ncbi:MAG: T9SS type A sorting domain-containing protein [Ignavibacteria bacterium]|nr:T9SS type A sorting domain-containing protein [Ignavibacteria bacterium]
MKKNFLLLFLVITSPVFSQLEFRSIPKLIDVEYYNKLNLSDIVKPRELPPLEYFEKGPERILTQSGIEIINIINGGGGQSETFIARHPNNPNIIVAASNDMRYNSASSGFRMAAYYSTNGGKTWSTSLTPKNADVFIPTPSSGGMTNVDPGLAFDSKGNLYYSYIFAQVSNDGDIEDGGVFMNRSTDGGKTWSEPIPVSYSVGGGGSQDAHDKPFIACDANPNSPFKDRIYVTWYLISPTVGPCIGFAYSTNGEEFSPTTKIPGSVGLGSVQSPMPIVASDGTLYVVWENKNNNQTSVYVQKSTTGGTSWAWSSPKVAQTVISIGEKVNLRMALPNKGNMRVSSHPYICLGETPNELFLVQAGKDENGKYRIYFAKTTNGGESWTSRIRVDDNQYGNDMFFPAIAYDPSSKILAVSYYSSQMDPDNKAVDLFVSVSFDKGNTWKSIRVTPTSWYLDHANAVIDAGGASLGRYWGDYLSMIAYDGKIIPCFWMPNNPRGTFYSNNAYVAILTTAPKPPEKITYINNYQEPSKIILKWKDPTENQLGGELKDFKIAIYKGTEKIAEVPKGVQEYTYVGLVDGESFSFGLKTIDNNGLESPLVTISGIAGGALEPLAPKIIVARPNEGGVLLTWQNPDKHIDSSFFHDYESLEVFSNDQKVYTIDKTNLLTGQVQSAIIPLPTKKFYELKIRSVGKRGTKLTPSQFSNIVLAYSGAPLSELSETFDNSNNMVPFYTNGNTDKWGITNKAANTPPNSLTDSPSGDYKPKSENYVIFAPVVPKSPNLTLSFEEIAIIDSSGDAGVISISDDFGLTWKDIAWIDMRRSSDFKDNVSQSKWFTESRSLADYENDTVFIKFTLISNPLKNKDGWYIDNVRLDNSVNKVEELVKGSNIIDYKAYPNPTSNNVLLELVLSKSNYLDVKLTDNLGNLLDHIIDNRYTNAGRLEITIDLANQPNGVYFVFIKTISDIIAIPITVVK